MIRFPFVKPKEPGAPAPEERAAEEPALENGWTPDEDTQEDAPTTDFAPDRDDGSLDTAADATIDPALDAAIDAATHGDGVAPPMEEQVRMVEAMLFASDKPLSTAELASRMPIGCDAAVAVRRVEEHYSTRGAQLARVAGKWAFRTAPDLAHLMTGEVVENRKLSRAALETLAIIAYHPPVTRAEIEEIRQVGVSKGTIDLLMELQWVKLGRRRQTPGRPVTFVTTDGFLEHFGLESVKDLPRLEELRQSGLLDNRPPIGYAPAPGEGAEEAEDAFGDEDDDENERASDQDPLI